MINLVDVSHVTIYAYYKSLENWYKLAWKTWKMPRISCLLFCGHPVRHKMEKAPHYIPPLQHVPSLSISHGLVPPPERPPPGHHRTAATPKPLKENCHPHRGTTKKTHNCCKSSLTAALEPQGILLSSANCNDKTEPRGTITNTTARATGNSLANRDDKTEPREPTHATVDLLNAALHIDNSNPRAVPSWQPHSRLRVYFPKKYNNNFTKCI